MHTLRPRPPPRSDENDAVLFHFLGPWQVVTVGSYGDCGWDAVDGALGVLFDEASCVGDLLVRKEARKWALAHSDIYRRLTGPRPTWVISTPVSNLDDHVNDDDYLNVYEDHDYCGTWPQWLESLVLPGRWLDYPALQCIADAFDISVFVVSVVDRELDVYHLGHVERQDGRLIMLVLMNGHWGYIARREGY